MELRNLKVIRNNVQVVKGNNSDTTLYTLIIDNYNPSIETRKQQKLTRYLK